MRLNLTVLFVAVGVLLWAKSDGGPGQVVEVRTSNAYVEVTGTDGDRVVVDDNSHATVRSMEGRVVIETDGSHEPLKLQAPRGASLDITTSNGAIRVSGVAGRLRLATSNGAITVRDAGPAEIHAHTSNGVIEMGVPRGLNADVSAHTSNGRIHSEVEIVTKQVGENFLEGKMGAGGPKIDLQTSNGSIYLMNAGDRESVVSTFKAGEVR